MNFISTPSSTQSVRLAVVWIIDTGAYFTGKIFGSRKLFPTVSPNKTWEGVYGAFFMYSIYSLFMVKIDGTWQEFALYNFGIWWLIILCFQLFFIAIFADLFESKLKRTSGKKDSGNILPGHGGLFDRFDATLAVGPLIIFFNIIIDMTTKVNSKMRHANITHIYMMRFS